MIAVGEAAMHCDLSSVAKCTATRPSLRRHHLLIGTAGGAARTGPGDVARWRRKQQPGLRPEQSAAQRPIATKRQCCSSMMVGLVCKARVRVRCFERRRKTQKFVDIRKTAKNGRKRAPSCPPRLSNPQENTHLFIVARSEGWGLCWRFCDGSLFGGRNYQTR